MNALLHDIRFSVRVPAKSPRITCVAILALGIGASTTTFSGVRAVDPVSALREE